MLFKRDESFRFTFENPVKATFKVLRLNQLNNGLKEGSALIIDLSPNGLRLSSSLDLPINEKNIVLMISFVLNAQPLSIMAEPIWKKRTSATSFSYGLVGVNDEETKSMIITELKEYTKKNSTHNV